MVIYCNTSGNVQSIPSTVPFGAVLDNVVIITPKYNATAILKVKPAYQEYIEDIICTPSSIDGDSTIFNAKLKKSITGTAGRVEYQIVLKSDGENELPSFQGSFNVSRGVMTKMPDTPEDLSNYTIEDIYIALTNLTQIYLKLDQLELVTGVPDIELQTVEKTVIGAINSLAISVKALREHVGEGDVITTEKDILENESGLIGLANALHRWLTRHEGAVVDGEDLALTEDPHHAQKRIRDSVDEHNRSTEAHSYIQDMIPHAIGEHDKSGIAHDDIRNVLSVHTGKIDENRTDLNAVIHEIGTDELQTSAKQIKGSINETLALSRETKAQSDVNRTNLVNLTAQLQGVARTYTIDNFLDFISFMNGSISVQIFEDRDGDGVKESYSVFVSDMKTGDNILIVEHNVPDFWFSYGANTDGAEKYEYNGVEYDLIAKDPSGNVVGLMHISETDYNVIANHAESAGVSAAEAKDAAAVSLKYRDEILDLADDIYTHQIAPPLSALDEAIILTPPTLAQLP